jgi:hypothetical protein
MTHELYGLGNLWFGDRHVQHPVFGAAHNLHGG